MAEKPKDMAFVGAYVPRHIASYLSLYCRHPGINKSTLIRAILDEWMRKQCCNGQFKSDLIEEWRGKIRLSWEAKKVSGDKTELADRMKFSDMWRHDLKRRGMDPTDIEQIMEVELK